MSSSSPSLTCESNANANGNKICQATSLPPLPRIIRHDKEAYFEQRLGLPPLPDNAATAAAPVVGASTVTNDDSTGTVAGKKKKKIPKTWIKNNIQQSTASSFEINDSSATCRLYMAPSSIPNSGLGMYAGTKIPPLTYIDLNPQIVIPLLDIEDHAGEKKYDNSVLSNYPWAGYSQGVHLEAEVTSLLYPNLGMLANSHLGLSNIYQGGKMIHSPYTRVQNRTNHPNTGANTFFEGLSFQTKKDATIEVGDEIFVDYGASYFHGREEKWGTLFPTKEDYDTANSILESFINEWEEEDGPIQSEQAAEDWRNIHAQLQKGEYVPNKDDGGDEEEEEGKKKEKLKTQQRIAFALPKSIRDITHVSRIGTARHSVPESTKSIEELQEHGLCLDNLRKGKSNLPQADNGAFATNNLVKGSVVVPAPLVPIKRDLLHVHYHGQEKTEERVDTEQILLNYCFGHPESSLVFFPYSSSVHYINHDGVNPNAYLKWSQSDMNSKEILQKDVDDVYTGLILEVVALRDINIGEEVTIDYGPDWQNAWHDHVDSWSLSKGEIEINPQSVTKIMNVKSCDKKPIRTIEEQNEEPYPSCIRTACFSPSLNEQLNVTWSYTKTDYENIRFCDITERIYNNDNYWYTAKIYPQEHDQDEKVDTNAEHVMTFIPHQAVFFIHDEYCSDIHLDNVFRQPIGVPEGLYPEKWLDMKKYKGEKATVTCDTTAGQFKMVLYKNWSPNGYDRAVELFQRGFYDNSHFFRVIPNFLVQFGMSYTEDESLKSFASNSINDDTQFEPPNGFVEGTISFAGSGPNSRTSHLFISYTAQNEHFGTMPWEVPIGHVQQGIDVVRKLNSSYGDMPPHGSGPEQSKISSGGRDYVTEQFPHLDEILKCTVA